MIRSLHELWQCLQVQDVAWLGAAVGMVLTGHPGLAMLATLAGIFTWAGRVVVP